MLVAKSQQCLGTPNNAIEKKGLSLRWDQASMLLLFPISICIAEAQFYWLYGRVGRLSVQTALGRSKWRKPTDIW